MANHLRSQKRKILANPLLARMMGKVMPPNQKNMLKIHSREYSALHQFVRNEATYVHYKHLEIAVQTAKECHNRGHFNESLDIILKALGYLQECINHADTEKNHFTLTKKQIDFFFCFLPILEQMRQSFSIEENNAIITAVNQELKAEYEEERQAGLHSEVDEAEGTT